MECCTYFPALNFSYYLPNRHSSAHSGLYSPYIKGLRIRTFAVSLGPQSHDMRTVFLSELHSPYNMGLWQHTTTFCTTVQTLQKHGSSQTLRIVTVQMTQMLFPKIYTSSTSQSHVW